MNVDDVITEARNITRDESFDDLWMVERINMGLQEIAAVLAIPGLSASDTVTATSGDGGHVALPSDFSHGLYLATTEEYPNGLILCENLKSLIARYDPEETGSVRMVTAHFQDLYFAPFVEEDEDITLWYYRNPDAVTLGDDLPSWVPAHLRKPLMVNYLAKEIFAQVEEGIDGQLPNTAKYSQFYGQAAQMLQAFYPKAPKPYYQATKAPIWF